MKALHGHEPVDPCVFMTFQNHTQISKNIWQQFYLHQNWQIHVFFLPKRTVQLMEPSILGTYHNHCGDFLSKLPFSSSTDIPERHVELEEQIFGLLICIAIQLEFILFRSFSIEVLFFLKADDYKVKCAKYLMVNWLPNMREIAVNLGTWKMI